MKTGIVNALDYGMKTGAGHGELNTAALRRAVKEMGAGGGTIFISSGVYEIAGAIRLKVSADPDCERTVRIADEDYPTLVQATRDSHFEIEERITSGDANSAESS
jgi:hypothetical protein